MKNVVQKYSNPIQNDSMATSLLRLFGSDLEKTLLKHKILCNLYTQMTLSYRMSQKTETIIKRIVSDKKIPPEIRKSPLSIVFTRIAQEMMFNDLEAVVWSIYLDKFAWTQDFVPLEIILYITSLAVKAYLNESISPFQAFLSKKYPSLSMIYNRWIECNRKAMIILPQELNKRFMLLYRPNIHEEDEAMINYNYYVDEVLEDAIDMEIDERNFHPIELDFLETSDSPTNSIKSEEVSVKENSCESASNRNSGSLNAGCHNGAANSCQHEELLDMPCPMLCKADSIFTIHAHQEQSSLFNSSISITFESNFFENSLSNPSDFRLIADHENEIEEKLPSLVPQASLFSSIWNGHGVIWTT